MHATTNTSSYVLQVCALAIVRHNHTFSNASSWWLSMCDAPASDLSLLLLLLLQIDPKASFATAFTQVGLPWGQ
jgi:hypothetical protein